MDALISKSQVDSLLTKTTAYTQKELIQLASFSFPSLADRLSNLSSTEKLTVQRLEGQNIYHYLNACRVAIGADTHGFAKLLRSFEIAPLIAEIKFVASRESSSKIQENDMYCVSLVHLILSNGDPRLNVKLNGQVPSKLFSFRQITADEWFSTVTGFYTSIVAHVLSLNDVTTALEFLFMQCAFHMHHSQPKNYIISELDYDEILKVAKQFISNYGE